MLPVVGVPKTVQQQMRPYRDLFRRSEGFEYVSRYITGLLVSPNKTLQGIHANQVWEGNNPGYRTMPLARATHPMIRLTPRRWHLWRATAQP